MSFSFPLPISTVRSLPATISIFSDFDFGISIEVATQYNTDYTNQLYSFTNNISTYEGGTHEDGVKRALTRIINNYAKNAKILKDKDEALTGDDVVIDGTKNIEYEALCGKCYLEKVILSEKKS